MSDYNGPRSRTPFAVSWLIDKMHVGMPFDAVLREVSDRLAANNVAPTDPDEAATFARERANVLTSAAIRHRQNRVSYRDIMSGGLR